MKLTIKYQQSKESHKYFTDGHHHCFHQFIIIESSKITMTNGETKLVHTPNTALWIPPYVHHAGDVQNFKKGIGILLPSVSSTAFKNQFTLLEVSPLITQLITRYDQIHKLEPHTDKLSRLAAVITDEICGLSEASQKLIMPNDKRVARVCDALQNDPSIRLTLKEWGKQVGASDRTLERIFSRETGRSFNEWRTLLRLEHAKKLLKSGVAVSDIAMQVGYESVSAFIAMFRSWNNFTPTEYITCI